jgi:hypothetical protein
MRALLSKSIVNFVKNLAVYLVALIIATASYPLALYIAELRISYIFITWYYPGKIVASGLMQIIPKAWIYGDPNSDSYWPQASYVGFTMLCAILFWSVILFLLWKIFAAKQRNQT